MPEVLAFKFPNHSRVAFDIMTFLTTPMIHYKVVFINRALPSCPTIHVSSLKSGKQVTINYNSKTLSNRNHPKKKHDDLRDQPRIASFGMGALCGGVFFRSVSDRPARLHKAVGQHEPVVDDHNALNFNHKHI